MPLCRQSVGQLDLQLIPDLRLRVLDGSRRKFDHAEGRPENAGQAKGAHALAHPNHAMLPIDEDYIDRECHSNGMDRLRGNDEQSTPGLERPSSEQTDHSPQAGVGNSDLLAQAGTPGRVIDTSYLAILTQNEPRLLAAGCAALSALHQNKQHHDEQNP